MKVASRRLQKKTTSPNSAPHVRVVVEAFRTVCSFSATVDFSSFISSGDGFRVRSLDYCLFKMYCVLRVTYVDGRNCFDL
jgi:hypothetical protein